MNITAIILTFNEEKHIARCINGLQELVSHVVVVDCFSTDGTIEIAKKLGAKVLQREWINYATQFNWALSQLDAEAEWILRIDADELLSIELISEIKLKLPSIGHETKGVYWGRRMTFQGRTIQYGGVFPAQVLRLFRFGCGECENRWMDEHVKVTGRTVQFNSEMLDDNLNSLTWWTDKHNKYASREAVDLLNLKFQFMPHDSIAKLAPGSRVGLKRWIKESVYQNLPTGTRSFLYFLFRYIIFFGFLDGRSGSTFHFLQGYWYRYLVDAKINEVEQYARSNKVGIKVAIKDVLGISL